MADSKPVKNKQKEKYLKGYYCNWIDESVNGKLRYVIRIDKNPHLKKINVNKFHRWFKENFGDNLKKFDEDKLDYRITYDMAGMISFIVDSHIDTEDFESKFKVFDSFVWYLFYKMKKDLPKLKRPFYSFRRFNCLNRGASILKDIMLNNEDTCSDDWEFKNEKVRSEYSCIDGYYVPVNNSEQINNPKHVYKLNSDNRFSKLKKGSEKSEEILDKYREIHGLNDSSLSSDSSYSES